MNLLTHVCHMTVSNLRCATTVFTQPVYARAFERASC